MRITTKNNYLIYCGIVIFITTAVAYSVIISLYPDLIPPSNKFGNFDNLLLIIFMAVIFAPVIEEVIFRGIFTKKKWFVFIFYLGGAVMILLTGNYYLVIFPAAIFLIYTKIKTYDTAPIYILNSVFFALLHYKLSDFSTVYSLIPIFFQFSLALIMLWITINYRLIWSIVFHFIVNASIIGALMISLQFPNTKQNTLRVNNTVLQWEKTPAFGSLKAFYSTDRAEVTGTTIENFINLFAPSGLQYNVNDSLRLYRYNFKIKNLNNEKIQAAEVREILQKAKLIENASEKPE